jgi:hypothetical protein
MSEPFEYLMALYSIIIGVGIAQLLTSVGHIIQAGKQVHSYWVHTAWVLLIFALHVLQWFGAWEYRAIDHWRFFPFLAFLSIPVQLYVLSILAFPDIQRDERCDLRAYYYERCGWIHGIAIATITLVIGNERFLLGRSLSSTGNLVRLGVVLVLLPTAVSKKPAVHAIQIFCLYGALVSFVMIGRAGIG